LWPGLWHKTISKSRPVLRGQVKKTQILCNVRVYRDLAEFQYHIRGNEVFFRPLDGWWPEALRKAGDFKALTAKAVADSHTQLPAPA
jgi:hypothetical protein